MSIFDAAKRAVRDEHVMLAEATQNEFTPTAVMPLPAKPVESDTVPTPARVAILNEGAKLTSGDRDATYGDPVINLACSGELKAVFRKYMQRKLSTAELEAIDMVLTKVGRIATGPKFHRDTYVDAATYMAIAGEMAMRDVVREMRDRGASGL